MTINFRKQLAAVALAVTMTLAGSTAAQAQEQTCQPGIAEAYFGAHGAQYQAIVGAVVPAFGDLATGLAAVVDQATYQTLLDDANALAAALTTGRVVITLPDGTVMIDTARDDNTAAANSNSYAHFVAKTINENHNSRIAILSAQQFACGIGVESKLSSSTGQTESYVAIRVGNHLDSLGTVRMSTQQ
jgi:hypothetical protein